MTRRARRSLPRVERSEVTRASLAARADRVAVVDGGRLVEHGTHADLMARGGVYARLFASGAAGVDRSAATSGDGALPAP